MAIYKMKEFAAECGLSPAALSVAKTRKKVNVITGDTTQDQRVDTDDPLNAAFLERCRAKMAKADGKDAPQGTAPVSEAKAEKEAKPDKPGPLLQLELDKKAVDLAKAQQDQAVNEIKLKKMRGELIPTELARATVKHLFTHFAVSFKQALDSLMIEIAHTTHINGNQQAELRGKTTRILNAAIEKGIADSKTSIDNIVQEYREDK